MMLCRDRRSKRRRLLPEQSNTHHTSDAEPSTVSHGYHKLLSEIQRLILDLACLAPCSSSSLFGNDNATLLSLSLVCRDFHEQVQDRLYHHIAITRPTQLAALYKLFWRYPKRADLVKSVHIGPLDNLPPHWWPISCDFPDGQGWDPHDEKFNGECFNTIATSLDETQLPEGYQDKQPFCFDRRPSDCTSCREAAIWEALGVAQRFINVDLDVQYRGFRRPFAIGNVWVARVFEVQAALDLYLLKVRSLEDARPNLLRQAQAGGRASAACRKGKCTCYPPLYLTEKSASSIEDAPPGAFKLLRADLLNHLNRPAAITNRLDHPLILSRADYDISITKPPGKGFEDYSPSLSRQGAEYEVHSSTWAYSRDHEMHACPDLAFLKRHYSNWGHGDNERFLDVTLGRCLWYARFLPRLTTNLKNLSLTGWLERALDWSDFKPRVVNLSVGPPPPGWIVALDLDKLRKVQKLRICGVPLVEEEIERIWGMERLQEVEWSLAKEGGAAAVEHLVEAIEHLLQDDGSSARGEDSSASMGEEDQAEEAEGEEESAEDGESSAASPASTESSSSTGEEEQPAPLVTVRLHPADVAKVLATAPSAETRAAWLEGREVGSAARRLKLERRSVSSGGRDVGKSADSIAREVSYEELRTWWRGIVG